MFIIGTTHTWRGPWQEVTIVKDGDFRVQKILRWMNIQDNDNLYLKDSVDFSLKQHSKQAIEIKTAWKKTLYWLINQNVFIGNRKWLAIDTDPCNSLSLGLTHSQTDQLMFAVKSDWHKSVQLFVGRFDRLDARPYQSGQISGQFCISLMLTIFFSVY